jgi:gamma-glutamyltranspeptidase/glutathione hydrolase
MPSYRPTITGTRHMVAAGHHAAAHAGFAILEAGGNAIDAGVAAGIAVGVLQTDRVNFAGVAPIMLYLADRREVLTLDGLGTWPRAAAADFFIRQHGGKIPPGILRTVMPAAPDSWITALERFGTMSFGEVAAAATRFARDGFPMHGFMADYSRDHEQDYRRWPSSAAVFLPNGRPPKPDELFVQSDLGRTLQYMVDEEAAHGKRGRSAGLQAARDAFYAAISRRRLSGIAMRTAGSSPLTTSPTSRCASRRRCTRGLAKSTYSPAGRGVRVRCCRRRSTCSPGSICARSVTTPPNTSMSWPKRSSWLSRTGIAITAIRSS